MHHGVGSKFLPYMNFYDATGGICVLQTHLFHPDIVCRCHNLTLLRYRLYMMDGLDKDPILLRALCTDVLAMYVVGVRPYVILLLMVHLKIHVNRIYHKDARGTQTSHWSVQNLQSTTSLAELWMLQIFWYKDGIPESLPQCDDWLFSPSCKICKTI